jgi:rhamnosyltransferase
MAAPLVSVILPTLEAEPDLERLLPSLAAQSLWPRCELVAIDSDSKDRTRELLLAFGADVARIAKRDFRHGATRNRAAAAARGEFLAFLSQDVALAGPDYLEQLIRPFADPRVAGVTARVLPHPESDLLTARTVEDLPEAREEPRLHALAPGTSLATLPAVERMALLRFNNVASAARAEVFRRIPFPDLAFAEDFAWAARVLTAGYTIAFEPRALARHGHSYALKSVFERYAVDACFHRQSHGHRIRPGLLSAARGLCFELAADWRAAHRGAAGVPWGDLLRAPGLRLAQIAGQWAGSQGWQPRRFRPAPVIRQLNFGKT